MRRSEARRQFVVEADVPSQRFTQTVLFSVGVLHLYLAYGTYRATDIDFHWVSVVLFFLSAIGCFHTALRIEHIRVVALTGAFIITAYASRAALLLYAWHLGEADLTDARFHISMASWLLATLYAYAVFMRGIAPLSRMYRVRRVRVETEQTLGEFDHRADRRDGKRDG